MASSRAPDTSAATALNATAALTAIAAAPAGVAGPEDFLPSGQLGRRDCRAAVALTAGVRRLCGGISACATRAGSDAGA